jgi:polyhydroxyalkanoate synthesis regulator protein
MASTFSLTPFAPLEETVRRNMELFQQTFSMFVPRPPSHESTDEVPAETSGGADSIEDLRRQMKEMQDRLERMSLEQPKKDE